MKREKFEVRRAVLLSILFTVITFIEIWVVTLLFG